MKYNKRNFSIESRERGEMFVYEDGKEGRQEGEEEEVRVIKVVRGGEGE